MGATTINIDDDTKKQAQELFKSLGLNLSTAINIFLKQSIREERIPFTIGEIKYNERVIKALQEVEEMKKNLNIGKRYSTSKEMIKDILENEK